MGKPKTATDQFKYDKTGIRGLVNFQTFGCNVFHESPPTPDKLVPNISFLRKVQTSGTLTAPDGKKIRYWGFADPKSAVAAERSAVYPSPTIRVRQGQIVHSTVDASKNAHTIHHHGIEPTTMNDGVGHVSFETTSTYTYQFQPSCAGTFFYHCHRNTPLHFQMGMKGFLIVDPPEGPGVLHVNGPRYDVERLWMFDDLDPRWHEIGNHDAGLCGEDVGLNRYEPKYFLCSGVFNNKTMTDPRVMVTATEGQKILLRILNASYSVLRITIDCETQWASCDGHGLGVSEWCSIVPYARGFQYEMVSAQRIDLILSPPKGTYSVKVEYLHWITGAVQAGGAGILQTKVVVS